MEIKLYRTVERDLEKEKSMVHFLNRNLQNKNLNLQQQFYVVKGRNITGYFSIPFDPKMKKDFEFTIGYEYYVKVYRADMLKYGNRFMICDDRIVIHTTKTFSRNPIVSVIYKRKLQTEIVKSSNNIKVLKRKNPVKKDLYGMKKTTTKIKWGGSSDRSTAWGEHHILENHSYKVGKGEIVLCDSVFVYREKGKPDICVAIVKYDEVDHTNTVQYIGKVDDELSHKCHKKIDDILFFGQDTRTKKLIRESLV